MENERYQIHIEALLGENSTESDSAQALGTITITSKEPQQKQSVKFEGGTVC